MSQFSSRSMSAVSHLQLYMDNFLSDREDKRIVNGEVGGDRPSISTVSSDIQFMRLELDPWCPVLMLCVFLVSSAVVEKWHVSFFLTW